MLTLASSTIDHIGRGAALPQDAIAGGPPSGDPLKNGELQLERSLATYRARMAVSSPHLGRRNIKEDRRLVREDPGNILVEFYDGRDGPTIHLDVLERSSILRLKELFLLLARGPQTIDLVREPQVQSLQLARFVLECISGDAEPAKRLRRIQGARDGLACHWRNVSSGWKECAELVEPLYEAEGPAHQYLTVDRIDDALVEVCIGGHH